MLRWYDSRYNIYWAYFPRERVEDAPPWIFLVYDGSN